MKITSSFKSIKHKLLFVIILTMLSALLVICTIMAYYDFRTYQQTWTNDIITQTEFLAGATTAALQFDDPDTASEVLTYLKYRPRIIEAAIYNTRGALFATYVKGGAKGNFPELPGEDGVKKDKNSLVSFKRIINNNEILGAVYIRSRYDYNERLLDYLEIVISVTFAALLIAILISLWLQSIITRPILSIANIAKQIIAEGKYTLRVEKISEDEVGELVDDFNEMLSVIEQRTNELELSNINLAHEIKERERAENEIMELNTELEKRVKERTAQLEVTNHELESFCYSVSHDLRGPLRAIDGFSQALIEELPDDMSEDAKRYFNRIRAGTVRMGQLIEDLLNLSRVSRSELKYQPVDISKISEEILINLEMTEPERKVKFSIWDNMQVDGDERLLKAAMENLLSNAWKFTSRNENANIEVGVMRENERSVYFVRDNGAGFDMNYVDKLFGAFQRLHSANEYPGTGIGLATVQRIIHRHGGRIWADAVLNKGAIFYFTLAPDNENESTTLKN